jgi:hypothetical protein
VTGRQDGKRYLAHAEQGFPVSNRMSIEPQSLDPPAEAGFCCLTKGVSMANKPVTKQGKPFVDGFYTMHSDN